MFIMVGSRMYGKVDRVPGVCHVVTKFGHLNFIPLLPVGSFVVMEGTVSGGEFQGKPIAMSLKSVLAGYLRVWIGAMVILAGIVSGSSLYQYAKATPEELVATGLLVASGVCALLSLFVSAKSGLLLQMLAHIGSIGIYLLFNEVVVINRDMKQAIEVGLFSLLIGNVGLLVFGLTRFWNNAGKHRSRQLLDELGLELPPEDGEEAEHANRWEAWDEDHQRSRDNGVTP